MRRYDRLEALAVILMGMLLAAVLYASAGCSERRDRTYYITGPAPAPPDTVVLPGDSCDWPKHRKHRNHKRHN